MEIKKIKNNTFQLAFLALKIPLLKSDNQEKTKVFDMKKFFLPLLILFKITLYAQLPVDFNLKEALFVLKENPYNYQVSYNLALFYFNQKNYHDAIIYNTKALAANPLLAEAYNNRGMCFYELKKITSEL